MKTRRDFIIRTLKYKDKTIDVMVLDKYPITDLHRIHMRTYRKGKK